MEVALRESGIATPMTSPVDQDRAREAMSISESWRTTRCWSTRVWQNWCSSSASWRQSGRTALSVDNSELGLTTQRSPLSG